MLGLISPCPPPTLPRVEEFSSAIDEAGEKVPVTARSLLCHATCSSVSGVSMATTKILHPMQPRYKSLYLYLLRVCCFPRRLWPGLLRGSLASWLPPPHPLFGFSLSQAGWGRGVVKETGICNYLFIYLLFSPGVSSSDLGIRKKNDLIFM